jgi:4-amino-4-deoxy-L-arabinose transferase-like glycosyltransferase
LAEKFLQGGGYHSVSRLPVVPFFIALFMFFFGNDPQVLHILGCILSSLAPLLTYYLGLKLTKRPFVAILSALYIAFSPFFIHEASYLDTENVFVPLVIYFFIVLADILNDPDKNCRYVWLGRRFTLIFLTRATLLAFPAFLFIYFVFVRRWLLGKTLARGAIFLVTFFILTLPWNINNYRHQGKIVFISESNGAVIGANNRITLTDPKLSGSWINLDNDYPEAIAEFVGIPGSITYEAGSKECFYSLRMFKKYPQYVPGLIFNKLKWLWSYSPKHPANRNFGDDLLGFIFYGALLPFFILALIAHNDNKLLREFSFLIVIYLSFFAVMTYGSARFRLPADPFIIILVTSYFFSFMKITRKGYKR